MIPLDLHDDPGNLAGWEIIPLSLPASSDQTQDQRDDVAEWTGLGATVDTVAHSVGSRRKGN